MLDKLYRLKITVTETKIEEKTLDDDIVTWTAEFDAKTAPFEESLINLNARVEQLEEGAREKRRQAEYEHQKQLEAMRTATSKTERKDDERSTAVTGISRANFQN